jgi:Xaa-Pro aminopeptidase
VNWAVYQAIKAPIKNTPSLIERKKTVKNEKEIEGLRQAHIRDGVALTAFLAWLERTLKAGPEGNGDGLGWPLTEVAVANKLEQMRASMDKFVGLSFDTISGYGSNGAIIHYRANPETCRELGTSEMYLLDSGAQYLDGTTDITRTMHFGEATEYQQECFTRVLKGHIALAQFKFPEGTAGTRFDVIARAALWAVGLDYKHGTGHGVGAHLNVHEGPQSISFRQRPNGMGFVPGMTVSNEPGYYEEGQFGIRIENIMVTKRVETTHSFGGYKFCGFDTVSFCPIQTRLVLPDLLTDEEIAWLNAYHSQVRSALTPLMQEKFPEAMDFLIRETEPIGRP